MVLACRIESKDKATAGRPHQAGYKKAKWSIFRVNPTKKTRHQSKTNIEFDTVAFMVGQSKKPKCVRMGRVLNQWGVKKNLEEKN